MIRKTVIPGLALMLAGCASFLSWDPPPQRQSHNQASVPVRPARPVGRDEYVVKRSDTMYSIAFRHNLDYRKLAQWNGIGSDYLIHPGQVLRLKAPSRQSFTEGEIVSHPVADAQVSSSQPRPLPDQSIGRPEEQGLDRSEQPVAIAKAPPASQSTAAPAVSGPYRWQWPTDGVVVRGYDPAAGSKGLDFKGQLGQAVVAAAPGKVVYSGSALRGYGELVIIKHDDVRLSAYGYNRKRLVSEGQMVRGGEPIAELGLGPENLPILHFEIRERGQPVNPVTYLPAK